MYHGIEQRLRLYSVTLTRYPRTAIRPTVHSG